jgi:hypothetical protein
MATPTANDLTRQQLEELDALLQRMLAAPAPSPARRPVPPTPSIPAVPPVVESWRVDPADLMPPRLHLELPEMPATPSKELGKPTFIPAEPPIPPTAPAPSIADELADEATGVPVTPSMPFRPESAVPFPEPSPEPIPLQSAEKVYPPRTAGVPPAMWPVYAVNWIVEEMLVALGGEALTRPAAKWALGLAGIAMIGIAAAWVVTGGQIFASFR